MTVLSSLDRVIRKDAWRKEVCTERKKAREKKTKQTNNRKTQGKVGNGKTSMAA